MRPGLTLTRCQLIAETITAWGFPCSVCLPVHACRRHYPGRRDENCSLVSSIAVSLPRQGSGSAPASLFSRLVRRSFTLQPACSPNRLYDPLHRRLQRPRYLSRCFGCYRVERTSSRAGMFPLKGTVFPRRTPCASLPCTSIRLGRDLHPLAKHARPTTKSGPDSRRGRRNAVGPSSRPSLLPRA